MLLWGSGDRMADCLDKRKTLRYYGTGCFGTEGALHDNFDTAADTVHVAVGRAVDRL